MTDILGRRFTDTLSRWWSEREFTVVNVDPINDDCLLHFIDGSRQHRYLSNVLMEIEDGELIESEQPLFVLPRTGAAE